ncbi:MAG: BsuPI-related putative proteinase inhibitor [Actinomycetota bacterium]|nr:BsuPI-related putative proteinase inhibitor [Actinomycetota bacterium]
MLRPRLATRAALVAVVLAGGCGGDADQTGDLPKTTGAGGLTLAVSWGEELVAGEPVTWVLTVANEGEEPVTLEFRSGRQGDVVLTADDGREAYRWSEERTFTKALVQHPLDAGGSATFELAEERLEVEPGPYRLTATVPSDPPVPPLERTVTIG